MKLVQVLNLTELELNRVDIRVGLSGSLYFMNGSPQAVRQLRNLVSQVSFSSLCHASPSFLFVYGFHCVAFSWHWIMFEYSHVILKLLVCINAVLKYLYVVLCGFVKIQPIFT